jgi:glycosyltransferase involved in cell wall biosynthesis
VRIGIFHTGGPDWTGGERYVRNLILALKQVPSAEPVFLAPANKTEDELAHWTVLGCDVLRVQSLNRWTPSWWLRQFARLTKQVEHDVWSEAFLKHHRIGVTYLRPCLGRQGAIPNISWVPDFQHLHLPEMFNEQEIEFRNSQISLAAEYSVRVVLSSHHAYQDFVQLFPTHARKGRVLQFVASVSPDVYHRDPSDVVPRYGLPKKFFYLPNQFWRHKNHLVVIKALGLLKRGGQDVSVVCTGNQKDYRHPQYWDDLNKAIADNGIREQLILLGMVSSDDIFPLIRQSVAVLNPSLFEGWSTTVEEAKSVGKRVLLSDIPVHREQDPPGANYFNPNSPDDLARKMYKLWCEVPPGPDLAMEKMARESLTPRLKECGMRFMEIVQVMPSY